MSLGGAICTLAAHDIYHREKSKGNDQTVKLLNERSFSDLADVTLKSLLPLFANILISAILSRGKAFSDNNSYQFIGKGLQKIAPLLKPFLQFGLWLTFGTLNAKKAYAAYPNEYKDYLFVTNDSITSVVSDKFFHS